MKLTTKGRYAVMAMADLASHSTHHEGNHNAGHGEGHRETMAIPLSDIARRQGISLPYLEQIMAGLRRAGFVTASRGPGGGYSLGAPADDIRIADIILCCEGPRLLSATRCRADSPVGCTGAATRCLTHDLWAELGRHIHDYLDSVSLADVANRRVRGVMPVSRISAVPSTPPAE
ncbi:MAG: Rrf2 family transcriptional regulator [Parvularculales bacterium]